MVCIICALNSVAEPPLFWAAPAPENRGPGADSSSDKIGLALLQVGQPTPGEHFVVVALNLLTLLVRGLLRRFGTLTQHGLPASCTQSHS